MNRDCGQGPYFTGPARVGGLDDLNLELKLIQD